MVFLKYWLTLYTGWTSVQHYTGINGDEERLNLLFKRWHGAKLVILEPEERVKASHLEVILLAHVQEEREGKKGDDIYKERGRKREIMPLVTLCPSWDVTLTWSTISEGIFYSISHLHNSSNSFEKAFLVQGKDKGSLNQPIFFSSTPQ